MPVDYDLAIVGGTVTGRWAALRAAQMGARVVLIEQPALWAAGESDSTGGRAVLDGLALDGLALDRPIPPALTVTGLAANGVDVRLDTASFLSLQPLGLQVGDACLTARKSLLALAGEPRHYDIAGLDASQCCSLKTLAVEPLPERVALVGEQATTIEAAVVLVQQGVAVTLVLPNQRLLPAEDGDVQRLVAAQLQALGVCWGTSPHFAMPHFAMGEGKIWLSTASSGDSKPVSREIADEMAHEIASEMAHETASEMAHETAHVVLTDTAPPARSTLRLPGLDDTGPLAVNAYLQTPLPDVYAVGPVLGGEDRLALSQLEAVAAVENALFWPRRAMRYDRIHYSLRALTPIGRAGLTEQQARRYREAVVTYQSGAAGATSDYAVDFCKLVVADGQLVGLHLMGDGAAVAIALLAPYLGHAPNRLVNVLADLEIADGLAMQIQQVLAQYRARHWQPGTWRRDWAENWFNWHRSR